MTKTELRQIYLARQRALSLSERAEKSRRIAQNFFERFDLSDTELLHCFIPIEKFNEVDTSPIIQALWTTAAEIAIAVPRVNFTTGEMESIIYTAKSELIRNPWAIREPVGGKSIEAAIIDMVLVPTLVFDRAGHRVGYGKGFYDRFLKKCVQDCVKIGLSYFEPIDKITNIHHGDIALDCCITPEGIFNADTRRSGDK